MRKSLIDLEALGYCLAAIAADPILRKFDACERTIALQALSQCFAALCANIIAA